MCGIIGYIGDRPAAPILLGGLQRLEYRGYDSAGIAVMNSHGELIIRKAVGKLISLLPSVTQDSPEGVVGLGHTRWATHGKPTLANAHPHLDCRNEVAVIHNGIIENYLSLRRELMDLGHNFNSQTDTEVVVHLIEDSLAQGLDLEEAVIRVIPRIVGAHAIAVLCAREPDKIVALRTGNAGGIIVGHGDNEAYLASDLPALLPHTQRVTFLSNGEMAVLTRGKARYYDFRHSSIQKETKFVPYEAVTVAKGGYKHFMLKEITEQPQAIMNTLRGRVEFDPPGIELENFPFSEGELRRIKRIILVGMGTSYHAALIGKYLIERLTRLPAEVENASEFRYRDPVIDPSCLVISVGQSGETVDTLGAMEEAARKGARQITICNAEGSQATRMAEYALYVRAGAEMGVASTKTFVASLLALYLLAAYLGVRLGVLSQKDWEEMVQALAQLPRSMGKVLAKGADYESLAHQYFKFNNFLFLGRGINYPVALEGALKLKEISYIHAEGYPAGEMKHGPIALIDETMPIVAIALKDDVHPKMLNNIEEMKARDGMVIALATEGDRDISSKVDHVLYIPQVSSLLSPILTVIPLQLFAYHIGVRRGCDVDQPRNLAKSVTVE